MDHAVRILWTSAGVCTLVVGAIGSESWESRLLVILSGIVTLLMSILLGGFVKHLTEHHEYAQSLEKELNQKAERLFDTLERQETKLELSVTKQQCEMVQRFNAQQLIELHHKIDALLGRKSHEESP